MADRVVKRVRVVTKVPPPPKPVTLKRVAAYARVSTDSDEQMGSVQAQKDYFEKLILKKPEWILVEVYADEGISGTSLKRRDNFNRMVADAMDGKIDIIITKSLSRFARNTVDALSVIRKLKSNQVGVYFEKEDIYTLDSKGEFLITLMSSLAEEESRSISENVKWGQRKRFADGKYHMPYKHFLGYKKGQNGEPELVEEEAKTIRIIFRLCLEGYSSNAIAKKLTDANIPSPSGKEEWQRQTVESILQNEKYYGAALLQKNYCEDYRTKKMRVNNGELPQYYVENGHEGIVTKEIFDAVQKRLDTPSRVQAASLIFSNKLFCSDCGGLYTPIPIHSTTYNDIVWKCHNRHLRDYNCSPPHLYEELLKPIFHEIVMTVLKKNSGVIRDCITAINSTRDTAEPISRKDIMSAVEKYNINCENEVRIWRTIIEKVVVYPDYLLEFHLITGAIIRYNMIKISPRMNKLSRYAKSKILTAHNSGVKTKTIAKEYDISSQQVRRIIKSYNNSDTSN